jgi:hypothetical protein
VTAIAATTSAAVVQPSAAISPSATRRPRSATAQRRIVFKQNTMPGWNQGRRASGLSTMPIRSAITIAGIGKTAATKGAAAIAATATSADSPTPGTMLRIEALAGPGGLEAD